MSESVAIPELDLTLCSGCGVCVEHCPAQAVELVAGRPAFVRPADCTYCGDCEELCPEAAIRCDYEIVWDEKAG